MEAKEAPEKIFLEWYRIGDETYRDWCITPKTNNEPVEYTRTDAFIEKACEFIANNMRCDGYTLQTKAKFIKEFKEAMKAHNLKEL